MKTRLCLFHSRWRANIASFFIFLAVIDFLSGTTAVEMNSEQAGILKDVLLRLGPANSTAFSSWNVTNDCDNWFGVTCDSSGNVLNLILSTEDVIHADDSVLLNKTIVVGDGESGNILNGTISTNITKLTHLEVLVLHGQSISGNIPTALGDLKNLTILDLGENGLEGQIPDSIGELTKLTHFDLGENYLGGYIPESIGNLTKLIYLDLGQNSILYGIDGVSPALSGEIPDKLKNLVSLKYLDLNECNFSGSPASVLQTLTSLKYLDLEGNGFEGLLTDFPESLPNLEFLYLGNNQFDDGQFPDFMSNYPKLKTLDLSSSGLTGDVSKDLNKFTSLETLDLSSNYLSSLPSNLSSLTNLKTLNLANNMLTSIRFLSGLINLKSLQIQMNGLTGPFPDLSNLEHLEYLDANTNFFTGELTGGIPSYVGTLKNISYLNLDLNNFGGQIPTSLFNLSSLTTLSCSKCGLEGPIPPEITKLSSLAFLDLHDNFLTGTIPSDIGNLVNLTNLDLSLNSLEGGIPESIRTSSINDLRLNDNLLSGSILNSFSTSSEILWLFSNNFNGPVPSEIGKLESLSDILFQNNNLTNGIPPELFNTTASPINLDLSGNNLGGVIPPEISKLKGNLNSLILSGCGLGGDLPAAISSFVNLVILDLSKNSFTGPLPSLKNLTRLKELSLNNISLTFDVSSLPPSPLEKLDIGSFGSGFDGLPNFPSSYNLSLLTLGLQSNNISGRIPARYFDRFEFLQAVFLQNNRITGDIAPVMEIPRGNDIEFINLSNNNLTLGSESLSGIGIALDLSYNPLCKKTRDPFVLNFCRSSENVLDDFVAPNKCNVSCTNSSFPNPYLYENANLCVCSQFVFVQISFSPTPLAYISNRCLRDVEDWVSGTIGVLPSQVRVTTANFTTGNPLSLVFYLQLFSTEKEAPGSNVLVPLYQLNRLEAPSLGVVDYVRILPVNYNYFDPSAAGKNKSDDSGLKPWLIAIIVILAILAVLIIFLLACLFYRRNGKSTEDQNPILPESTYVEGNRQYVQFRAES